jgi:hypothetical protein
MALNAAVIMPPLQQVIFDKTLDTFLAGGQVYFFEDANRTIPKDVYELTGTGPGSYTYTSLGHQLTLSGIGSFVDHSGANIAIYLWPFTGSPNDNPPSDTIQNYYITVYSSTGVFQFDIPNWPGVTANESPVNTADTTDNIISNPQFVDITFSPASNSITPSVFTTTGTNTETIIAPDWSVITTGSGSFSVYQEHITDSTAPGNPPYALGIISNSYSQPIHLRQRILSPRLFSGQYVSGTFLSASLDGGAHNLSMTYTPSITGTIQTVCSGTTNSSGYTVIANSIPVQITNPGDGTGYIDVDIVIPVGANLLISNIQLCGVSSNTETVAFLEQTPEREIDHLFHYFQPQLNFKPIPSLLVGWDFPLNPAQANAWTIGINTTPKYILDQTIAACSSSTYTTAQDSVTGALNVTPVSATQSFYLLQYLKIPQALNVLGTFLSSNLFSWGHSNNIKCEVNLYVGPDGQIPILPTSIVTIADNGTVALTGSAVANGWTAIPNIYFQTPQVQTLKLVTVENDINEGVDLGFNGWQIASSTVLNTTAVFAIVVSFTTTTIGQGVTVNSISLVPGDIPTRPAPQTADEVLRECQYYYEKSYLPGVYAGAAQVQGSVAVFQNSELFTATNTAAFLYYDVIYLQLKQTKQTSAYTVTFYSISGTLNNVTASLRGFDSGGASKSADVELVRATFWTETAKSDSSVYYIPVTSNLGDDSVTIVPNSTQHFIGTTAWVAFHYIVDARLGIV